MVDPARARSVYRYFDLADSFVRILVLEPGSLRVRGRLGLNRAGYRRLILQTCMPDLGEDVQAAITEIFPEDPLLVEDLLYQLCVEVNPELDIHEVRIAAEGDPTSPLPSQEGERPSPKDKEAEGDCRDGLRARARNLEKRLAQAVIGQEAALSTVVRAVRRAAAGLASDDRPLASMLFAGRTGTGKTELARCLAKELYGQEGRRELLRIDCTEFALAHEYAKLIGSPPGYVGHEQGGQLTEALLENPECLVLFDEVEKAHPRLHGLLLQILEEGDLTDGRGRRVSLNRTIVVMTSNVGAAELTRASRPLGFERQGPLGSERMQSIVGEALDERFAPELLGRLDSIVLFEELSPGSVEAIARKQLFELARRTRGRGMKVAFTPAVARWVAHRGYAPEAGARELRRVIEREIEPALADRLLAEESQPQGLLRVRVARGELRFDHED